jgi:iron-sulfur cluster assembly protein
MDVNLIEQTDTGIVSLTESAAGAVQELMAKRDLQGYALRVFISGGGCSGFQYGMALEGNPRAQDTIFEQHGVKLVVDEVSIQYLRGATVDYVDELMGSGFKIHNPNAVSTCGCGNSFRTSGEANSEGGGGCGCGSHN